MKSIFFIILLSLYTFSLIEGQNKIRESAELMRYDVSEAKQGVAVDKDCFYVINSSTIVKYSKSTGAMLASWDGNAMGLKHLNSGVVIKGRLYCANSNYPDSPMAGSIEIFDAVTLKHIGSHSFGILKGSVTWIDEKDGAWYAGFAHYSERGSSEGKDTRWTSVVKFDNKWRETGSWIFPGNIVKLFTPMSNSGGAFGNDGKLYCTGHDEPEIYVMEIPGSGYTLNHIETITTPVHGQGISIDRSVRDRNIVFGIRRSENTVIAFEIKQIKD